NVDVRHTGSKPRELKLSHLLPVDHLGVQIKSQPLDQHVDVVHRQLGVPSPVDMKHQGAQTELGDYDVQQVGTVQAAAEAKQAVKIMPATGSLDRADLLLQLLARSRVGPPLGPDILFEIRVVITRAFAIKRDGEIGRASCRE